MFMEIPMKNAKDTYMPGFAVVDPDMDWGFTEQKFQECASLEEGINGCASMDTTFENTSEETVTRPRSDGPETGSTHRHPAPRDTKLGYFPQRRF